MSIFLFFIVVAAIVGIFCYRYYRETHTDTHALIHKEFYGRNWEIIKISRRPMISSGLNTEAKVYHVAYYNEKGERRDCNVVNSVDDTLRFYEGAEQS